MPANPGVKHQLLRLSQFPDKPSGSAGSVCIFISDELFTEPEVAGRDVCAIVLMPGSETHSFELPDGTRVYLELGVDLLTESREYSPCELAIEVDSVTEYPNGDVVVVANFADDV